MENHYNCIYCFTNKLNGKKYIGQTINFNKRLSEHKYRSGKDNLPFHNAINKYGIENFEITILVENIETQEELNDYEKLFIKKFNTGNKNFGYNVAEGGSNGNVFKYMNKEKFDDFTNKVSQRSSEMWNNRNEKERQDVINKIANGNRGKVVSEETKKKISESLKKAYEEGRVIPHNKGKSNGEKKYKNKKEHEVIRYDEKTKQYKFYKMKSIAKDDGFDESSIGKCCKGQRKSHGGYRWFYLNDFVNFLMNTEVMPMARP